MFVRILTISRKPGASSTSPVSAPARDRCASSERSALRFGLRRRLASESGFTLIEVLVVAAILPLVLVATLGPFEFAQKQTPKNVEYTTAISSASTGLQRMMREIRQAYRIDGTTPNSIDFNAVINSSDLEILYSCNVAYPTNTGNTHAAEYRRCKRVSATTGTTLPSISAGVVVIDRLLDGTSANPVFTFKNSSGNSDPTHPTYVEARIRVPARGELNSGLNHAIELDNGTALPNLALDS
jgi:prepilin-type N-terminal cleavage/methylation domain-containing protein